MGPAAATVAAAPATAAVAVAVEPAPPKPSDAVAAAAAAEPSLSGTTGDSLPRAKDAPTVSSSEEEPAASSTAISQKPFVPASPPSVNIWKLRMESMQKQQLQSSRPNQRNLADQKQPQHSLDNGPRLPRSATNLAGRTARRTQSSASLNSGASSARRAQSPVQSTSVTAASPSSISSSSWSLPRKPTDSDTAQDQSSCPVSSASITGDEGDAGSSATSASSSGEIDDGFVLVQARKPRQLVRSVSSSSIRPLASGLRQRASISTIPRATTPSSVDANTRNPATATNSSTAVTASATAVVPPPSSAAPATAASPASSAAAPLSRRQKPIGGQSQLPKSRSSSTEIPLSAATKVSGATAPQINAPKNGIEQAASSAAPPTEATAAAPSSKSASKSPSLPKRAPAKVVTAVAHSVNLLDAVIEPSSTAKKASSAGQTGAAAPSKKAATTLSELKDLRRDSWPTLSGALSTVPANPPAKKMAWSKLMAEVVAQGVSTAAPSTAVAASPASTPTTSPSSPSFKTTPKTPTSPADTPSVAVGPTPAQQPASTQETKTVSPAAPLDRETPGSDGAKPLSLKPAETPSSSASAEPTAETLTVPIMPKIPASADIADLVSKTALAPSAEPIDAPPKKNISAAAPTQTAAAASDVSHAAKAATQPPPSTEKEPTPAADAAAPAKGSDESQRATHTDRDQNGSHSQRDRRRQPQQSIAQDHAQGHANAHSATETQMRSSRHSEKTSTTPAHTNTKSRETHVSASSTSILATSSSFSDHTQAHHRQNHRQPDANHNHRQQHHHDHEHAHGHGRHNHHHQSSQHQQSRNNDNNSHHQHYINNNSHVSSSQSNFQTQQQQQHNQRSGNSNRTNRGNNNSNNNNNMNRNNTRNSSRTPSAPSNSRASANPPATARTNSYQGYYPGTADRPKSAQVYGPPVGSINPSVVELDTIKWWIRSQVEYYFSIENLCRDMYFRSQMSPVNGGVPLRVFSGFNRMRSLINMAHANVLNSMRSQGSGAKAATPTGGNTKDTKNASASDASSTSAKAAASSSSTLASGTQSGAPDAAARNTSKTNMGPFQYAPDASSPEYYQWVIDFVSLALESSSVIEVIIDPYTNEHLARLVTDWHTWLLPHVHQQQQHMQMHPLSSQVMTPMGANMSVGMPMHYSMPMAMPMHMHMPMHVPVSMPIHMHMHPYAAMQMSAMAPMQSSTPQSTGHHASRSNDVSHHDHSASFYRASSVKGGDGDKVNEKHGQRNRYSGGGAGNGNKGVSNVPRSAALPAQQPQQQAVVESGAINNATVSSTNAATPAASAVPEAMAVPLAAQSQLLMPTPPLSPGLANGVAAEQPSGSVTASNVSGTAAAALPVVVEDDLDTSLLVVMIRRAVVSDTASADAVVGDDLDVINAAVLAYEKSLVDRVDTGAVDAVATSQGNNESSSSPETKQQRVYETGSAESPLIGWIVMHRRRGADLHDTNGTDTAKQAKEFTPNDGPGADVLSAKGFVYQHYTDFRDHALQERASDAAVHAPRMDMLYHFWANFLHDRFNRQMHDAFKQYAVEDVSRNGSRHGLACLYRFYVDALAVKPDPVLFAEFQTVVRDDWVGNKGACSTGLDMMQELLQMRRRGLNASVSSSESVAATTTTPNDFDTELMPELRQVLEQRKNSTGVETKRDDAVIKSATIPQQQQQKQQRLSKTSKSGTNVSVVNATASKIPVKSSGYAAVVAAASARSQSVAAAAASAIRR